MVIKYGHQLTMMNDELKQSIEHEPNYTRFTIHYTSQLTIHQRHSLTVSNLLKQPHSPTCLTTDQPPPWTIEVPAPATHTSYQDRPVVCHHDSTRISRQPAVGYGHDMAFTTRGMINDYQLQSDEMIINQSQQLVTTILAHHSH